MKCAVSGKQIQETYLKKILGTYVKDEKGKKFAVSHEVQHEYKNDKEAILAAIKKK